MRGAWLARHDPVAPLGCVCQHTVVGQETDSGARHQSREAGDEVEWREAAGHGGASGRYDRWRDRAFQLAWLLAQVGITR